MQQSSTSLIELFACPWRNRYLLTSLAKRDIATRYRGSVLGGLWSLFTPLLMLSAYTFVFSVVFEARWDVQVEDKSSFALILFCGLILFTFFADMVNQAPNLVLNNPAYVKKIVFPLDCLVWVGILTSLFNLLTSFTILLFVDFLTDWYVHWTTIFFPLVLPPLVLMTLGASLFLASIGVFLRDVSQITGVVTTFIMFMSPIFYPISAIPEGLRGVLSLNPLAPLIAQARRVVIWGELPEWRILGLVYLVSVVVAWGGFFWFQKTRKGFADVL